MVIAVVGTPVVSLVPSTVPGTWEALSSELWNEWREAPRCPWVPGPGSAEVDDDPFLHGGMTAGGATLDGQSVPTRAGGYSRASYGIAWANDSRSRDGGAAHGPGVS